MCGVVGRGDKVVAISYQVLASPDGLFRMVGRTSLSDSYAFVRFSALGADGKCRVEVEYIRCYLPVVLGFSGTLPTNGGAIVAVRVSFYSVAS